MPKSPGSAARRVMAGAGLMLVAAGFAPAAHAQGAGMMPGTERPALIVSADAEVKVVPDRAHLTIGVETRARTLQQAGADNARIQTAVLDAIRRQGIAPAQLQTRAVQVTPEYEYPREGGRPTVTGYVARNEIAVEVRDLSKVGAIIDAAIGRGATNVNGPRFTLSDPDAARREALSAAVKRAMADAQTMAEAAGVRVGGILELSSEFGGVQEAAPVMAMMRASADAAPTPVESGLVTVRAQVRLRIGIAP